MVPAYASRSHAGHRLAPELGPLADPLILGLARGGVIVAAAIAEDLHAPVGAYVVRKVGAPGQEELGVGALAEGEEEPIVSPVAAALGLSRADVATAAAPVRAELARQVAVYRGGRPLPDLTGRDVVVADDGLATGVTAQGALVALRRLQPRHLILAVPVGAPGAVRRLQRHADRVICPEQPEPLLAVGRWYADFAQVTDDEVLAALG